MRILCFLASRKRRMSQRISLNEASRNTPGLENLCAHALRHSFASMAAALGYSDAIIAGLLGHKLHTVTNRYTHLTDKSLIRAADVVSEKIAEQMNLPLN